MFRRRGNAGSDGERQTIHASGVLDAEAATVSELVTDEAGLIDVDASFARLRRDLRRSTWYLPRRRLMLAWMRDNLQAMRDQQVAERGDA
jgi:hypothetical protein